MKVTTLPERPRRRADAAWVLRQIDDLIAQMGPGDRIPSHRELTGQFGASERAVLHALGELQRQGKIVRRHGSGTFVAETVPPDGGAASGLSLTVADSRTIVAVARPDQGFFDLLMQELLVSLEQENLHLSCRLLGPEAPQQLFTPPNQTARPLGFIIFRNDLTPLANRLYADGNRVVLVGTPSETVPTEVPTVHGDHEYGGYLAMKHLVDLGHRRIAVAFDDRAPQMPGPRRRGHERALREAARAGFSADCLATAPEVFEDPSRVHAYLRREDAPTAVVAWNDTQALSILSALQRAGLRVPEELSLIGYDAAPQGLLVHPALSTVDPARSQLLRTAVEMLTSPIVPKTSRTVVITPTLVPRASTASPCG